LLMVLEIFTFLGAALVFVYYRKNNLDEFVQSKEMLSTITGTVNTIILITSGYFMALSVNKLREDKHQESSKLMFFGLVLGIVFLIVKGTEFYLKIESGIGFNHNTFFTFYWLMTGFHFVHVLFGVGLIAYINKTVKNKKYTSTNMFDVEASATYWHMCDLIWILIFPILYLL
ncbi:cytochrome c oxidase subunit 3, partial [bacterium]|nr:cytochrome c oxidase subunit 3 [bacterium]